MRFKAVMALAMAAMLSACGLNSVPTAEENAKARWADVQADYQRRANLIPNLVSTVKASAQSEGKILSDVINARARATQVNVSADDLTDAGKMQQYSRVQGNLNGSLSRLLATVERYPELKSQDNFQTLMSQLEGSENRIAIAIRDYNEAVEKYNVTIRTFPDAIGAKVFYGAKPMVPYQATTPNADVAPTVDFGNMN
ncbi:LemA family protein [Stakelama pacifica]|uniref:LemA protein n=1 Tax=Stakelama pacifica TaxID=517720 RepID=A0A4R6FUX5_9SPHN|nr:LemA family protein [Stakelama pacifica]TDN85689.1 LemA protein [Stakelama pacifica]GGO91921.1 LemA protein [Stakelama pacifica]